MAVRRPPLRTRYASWTRPWGAVLATLERNGGFKENALIISADHGGSARGHFRFQEPEKPENVTIPWICVGPGVPAGLRIELVLRTYDTAPTALAFLGLGHSLGIDGQSVADVLGAISTSNR